MTTPTRRQLICFILDERLADEATAPDYLAEHYEAVLEGYNDFKLCEL